MKCRRDRTLFCPYLLIILRGCTDLVSIAKARRLHIILSGSLMNELCKAITNKGKQCKRKALSNEEYCREHLYLKFGELLKKLPLYKKPSFIIGTILAILAIFLTIYFGMRGLTKIELTKIVKEAVQQELQNSNVLPTPPKTDEEILKAIGKTCDQIGQAACDKIKKASEDLDSGHYLQAETSYKTLIDLFPDVFELRFNLASAYYYQNKLNLAEKELREIIRTKPDINDVHYNLGILLYDLKKYPEAEKEYRTAIKIYPDDVEAHIGLGNLLSDLKNYQEAQKEYRTAIEIDSTHAGAHNNLGNLLEALKNYPEAEKEYRIAIKIKPDYAEAHNNLGVLLVNLKRFPEAENEFRTSIEIDPNNADAHNNLGNLLKDLKNYQEAEKEYRTAINIKPDYAEAHGNLGLLYIDMGKKEEAKKELQKAKELFMKQGREEDVKKIENILKGLI